MRAGTKEVPSTDGPPRTKQMASGKQGSGQSEQKQRCEGKGTRDGPSLPHANEIRGDPPGNTRLPGTDGTRGPSCCAPDHSPKGGLTCTDEEVINPLNFENGPESSAAQMAERHTDINIGNWSLTGSSKLTGIVLPCGYRSRLRCGYVS